MRHTNFKSVDETFSVINTDNDSPLLVLKFKLGEAVSEIIPDSIQQINNHYIANISCPSDDCFLLVSWCAVVEIVRVGTPDVLLMVHSEASQTINFTQYSLGGAIIGSGTLTEIQDGFYYTVPYSYVDSFFEIDSNTLITMKLPYLIGEPVEIPDTGAGVLSDQVFLDTPFRYATFAFTGDRYSYFDIEAGQWKPSPEPAEGETKYTVKASDIALAFCSYYGISYDRTADVNVTQYISAIRAFDENVGFFRVFNPGITPLNNQNNFDLIYNDEFNNTVYVGIQSLFTGTPLTQAPDANNSQGIVLPFANTAFENKVGVINGI
jgi:hypothetical protein